MKNLLFLFLSTSFCFSLNGQCDPAAFDPSTNDPFWSEPGEDWRYDLHKFECAWEITMGDPNITVAVVDKFPAIFHNDLASKIVESHNINPNFGETLCDHGLAVSGVIAAVHDNGNCTAGVGGLTTIAAYHVEGNVCNSGGAVYGVLDQAMDDGHPIVNLSWQGGNFQGRSDVISYIDGGGVFVTSASNKSHLGYSDLDGAINVGRMVPNALGQWQNWDYGSSGDADGEPDQGIDIFTQHSMVTTRSFQQCFEGTGTSTCAPKVAGTVALMLAANPNLSAQEVECIIKASSQGFVRDSPLPMPKNTFARYLDAEAAVIMAQAFDQNGFSVLNMELTGTKTIHTISVTDDLIIKSGADITVNGQIMLFNEDSEIIVERGARLTIDGALIKNSGCIDRWQGFVVEGNTNLPQPDPFGPLASDNAGILILQNNTIVENAKKAVTMTNYQYSWPTFGDYYGGLVIADQTTFINNGRSFEFMKYGSQVLGTTETSRITNCTFDGNSGNVITCWAGLGMEVNGNTFVNYDRHGLLSINGDFTVNGNNQFFGVLSPNPGVTANSEVGVGIYNTFMSDATPLIDGNTFSDGFMGVWLEGTSAVDDLSKVEIKNNNFTSQWFGTLVQGTNEFEISENVYKFAEVIGLSAVNSGDVSTQNVVRNNFFQNQDVGVFASNKNNKARFFENCFQNHSIGAFVLSSSKDPTNNNLPITPALFPVQTTDEESGPDNCFENNVGEIIANPNGEPITGVIFEYGRDASLPQADCRVPVPQSFFEDATATTNGRVCDSAPPPGPPPTSSIYQCTVPTEIQGGRAKIEEIENLIAAMMPIDSTDFTQRYLLERLNECLKQVKRQLITSLHDAGLNGEIINEFKGEQDPYIRVAAFSEFMQVGDYNNAEAYLSQSSDEGSIWDDFVYSQRVNIEWLKNPRDFVPTQLELSNIYQAGLTQDFYATWSRAIYTALTDECILLPMPGQSVQPRSAALSERSNVQYYLYPNPTSDIINIGRDTNLPGSAYFRIFSQLGIEVLSGSIPANEEIVTVHLDHLAKGVYFLELTESDVVVTTQKIIKL